MQIFQKSMIFLARNKTLTGFIHRNRLLKYVSESFVGGKNEGDIINKTALLKKTGVDASFFYLGEYVEDRNVVEKTISSLIDVIIKTDKTDIHVSVDPTQAGLMIDYEYCLDNMRKIASEIKGKRDGKNDYLMIDMEDSSVTEQTISIYQKLIEERLPVGITLQAYLKRTLSDLEDIISRSEGFGRVRLVKGAFAEKENAYLNRDDIDKSFFDLATLMLDNEKMNRGLYPVFATHDHRMIDRITLYAENSGVAKKRFEFEMLYGVRSNLQKKIVKDGFNLRLYTPYGTDWWPYSIRRIGENPRNLFFVLRSLYGRLFKKS